MSEENPDTGSVLGSNIEMDFNQTYKFDAAELSRRGEKIKFCKETVKREELLIRRGIHGGKNGNAGKDGLE